jgi:hypothetical protein
MVFETQQFVSSLVYNQIRPPKVFWSDDYTKLTIDGETLVMDHFRSGIKEMLADAWKLYLDISGGHKFAVRTPESFRDNLPNDTRGYSFLDEVDLAESPHSFLLRLVKDSRFKIASVDSNNRLSWNIPGILEFFYATAKFNELLAVLSFILPTINTRGTTFVDHKFRNDLRPRNLLMLTEEMFFLVRYHKMTNQTGLDACIPAFFPPCLIELMLEYLGGGCREAEEILARVVWGETEVSYYQL